MRVWAFAAGLVACVVSGVAYAQTWSAGMVFVSGTQGCQHAQSADYTYTLEGTTLTLTLKNGGLLTKAPVSATGDVSQDFRTASGNRLRLVGNVKTRDLALLNTEYGCRWNTPPKQ